MKMHVFTKTFNNENELNEFVNNHVGDKYYWTIRTRWVNIYGLTITIVMRNSSCFHKRRDICIENGFDYERKEV